MKQVNRKYPIVVFEGIDGAGKTTVAQLVAKKFVDCGLLQPRIVHPLHDSDVELDLCDDSYKTYLLSLAAHADVWQRIIFPQFTKNVPVFLDRGAMSVAVYQGAAFSDVMNIYSDFHVGNNATAYVYLDVKPETAYQRIKARGEVGINESLEELQQAYNDYTYALDNARFRWPDRVKVIDANGTLESVVQAVFDVITE